MSGSGSVRGQPLVALLAVLAGWTAGRIVNWEPPELAGTAAAASSPDNGNDTSAVGFVIDGQVGPQSLPGRPLGAYPAAHLPAGATGRLPVYVPNGAAYPALGELMRLQASAPSVGVRPFFVWNPAGSVWGPSARMFMPRSGRAVDGNSFDVPTPNRLAPEVPAGSAREQATMAAPSPVPLPGQPQSKRWSFDSWALLRRDGGGVLSQGGLPATYGASQDGAILRYRLDRTSRYRPAVYARVTSALNGVRQSATALGISARPVPSLPLVVAAEGRLMDQSGGTSLESAIFAYTELPPLTLRGNWRAETYLQGGYVSGAFATPFADGQVRLDHGLLQLGPAKAYLGGGVWGGAQRGARRLDVGPSASIAFPLSRHMYGRLSLDWRFRMAGNAQPGSGPAVTISAGF